MPHCFPRQLHHVTSPLTVHRGSNLSTSLPKLAVFYSFDNVVLIGVRWYPVVLFCISLIRISFISKGVLFYSGETFTLVKNETCNSYLSTRGFHPLLSLFHLCNKHTHIHTHALEHTCTHIGVKHSLHTGQWNQCWIWHTRTFKKCFKELTRISEHNPAPLWYPREYEWPLCPEEGKHSQSLFWVIFGSQGQEHSTLAKSMHELCVAISLNTCSSPMLLQGGLFSGCKDK